MWLSRCLLRKYRLNSALRLVALVYLSTGMLWAEAGVLVVHVKDARQRPVVGLQIGVEGDGGSDVTGDDGKARIRLAKQTKQNTKVTLQIVKSPPGKDFVLVSPWDHRTLVPSFENESDNFVEVVVVQSGDRAALENGSVLAALTAGINKSNFPKTVKKETSLDDPRAALALVAKRYGLVPDELDEAIRAWGSKTKDPYEAGLASLYEQNYSQASIELTDSLRQREKNLATDQEQAADAACFLAQSLYREGKYRQSVAIYRRCRELRADDPKVLNNLAVSLAYAGNYAEAEEILRSLREKEQAAAGTESPTMAAILESLGFVLKMEGRFGEAQSFYEESLKLRKRLLGPEHPDVASTMNGLAAVVEDRGDYAAAEQIYRHALEIQERLGPDRADAAITMSNLGRILREKEDWAGAALLYQRALTIQQNALGPNHPRVAIDLSNLADLIEAKGEYDKAEDFCRRALEIRLKMLGPGHVDVATSLDQLGSILNLKGEFADAEPQLRRAILIYEQDLGKNHPYVAKGLGDLAFSLRYQGRVVEAEELYRRELRISEESAGPEHPDTAALNNLGTLLQSQGKNAEAEEMFKRALRIIEKAWGPNTVEVATALNNIGLVQQAQGQIAAAKESYGLTLDIAQAKLGQHHPSTERIRQNLQCLIAAGNTRKQ